MGIGYIPPDGWLNEERKHIPSNKKEEPEPFNFLNLLFAILVIAIIVFLIFGK